MWLQWRHHFEIQLSCLECSDCARGWHGKLFFYDGVVKPLKLIEGRASHGTGGFASGVSVHCGKIYATGWLKATVARNNLKTFSTSGLLLAHHRRRQFKLS